MRAVAGRRTLVGLSALFLILTVAAPPRAVAAPAFQAVGNMTRARNLPVATLLQDGSVLVTGGLGSEGDQSVILPSAERFDPKTNTFAGVSAMETGRFFHTAALLPDGQVMVLGGTAGAGTSLNSVEMFDPGTETFTRVADLLGPREQATATVLADGRVLVVGGLDRGAQKILATAELFDPATGEFKATGALASPRIQHAAALLADGRVAILGGANEKGEVLKRVEIYDPKTGVFEAGGDAAAERAWLTATPLPGGKVLLAGGYKVDPRLGTVVRNSVEIYDPATRQSTITGTLAAGRYLHTAVLLKDGRVLLAGGSRSSTTFRSAELVDPATGKAALTAFMLSERTQAAAVALTDGRALVLGGVAHTPAGDEVDLASAEVFVP